jgi:hypothetical protein
MRVCVDVLLPKGLLEFFSASITGSSLFFVGNYNEFNEDLFEY